MFFNIHSFNNILFNFYAADSVLDAECKKMSDTFLPSRSFANGEARHVQRAVEGKDLQVGAKVLLLSGGAMQPSLKGRVAIPQEDTVGRNILGLHS